MMQRPLFAVVILATISSAASSSGQDLVVSLRLHAKEIQFGDPLYIEVTLTNRGSKDFEAERKYIDGEAFRFEQRDPETGLVKWIINAEGQAVPTKLAAGKTVRFYKQLFFPPLGQASHEYWKPFKQGQELLVCAVYPLTYSGIELRSKWNNVYIRERDPKELEALERWANTERVFIKGPHTASFGLGLVPMIYRENAHLAGEVKGEEIATLLNITMQLQKLYLTPAEEQKKLAEDLATWIKSQPPIRKEALGHAAVQVARSYEQLFPTANVLEESLASAKASGDK